MNGDDVAQCGVRLMCELKWHVVAKPIRFLRLWGPPGVLRIDERSALALRCGYARVSLKEFWCISTCDAQKALTRMNSLPIMNCLHSFGKAVSALGEQITSAFLINFLIHAIWFVTQRRNTGRQACPDHNKLAARAKSHRYDRSVTRECRHGTLCGYKFNGTDRTDGFLIVNFLAAMNERRRACRAWCLAVNFGLYCVDGQSKIKKNHVYVNFGIICQVSNYRRDIFLEIDNPIKE